MSVTKIKIKQKGFKSEEYLQSLNNVFTKETFAKLAKESLEDFKKYSPTVEIATGWSYEVKGNNKRYTISFNNLTFENGENIAIIVDVGHATQSGNWVPGKNYLKEPIKRTYERINELLKGV